MPRLRFQSLGSNPNLMTTTFLLEAGFCQAANAYRPEGTPSSVKGYPLAVDLRSCFDPTYSFGSGIEAAFAEAEHRHDPRPEAALVERLLEADHYLGAPSARDPESPYRRFVQAYPSAMFLTFNYDALLEFSLLAQGRWIPADGFGVPADSTVPAYYRTSPIASTSSQCVLHLHGSLYLYPREFDIEDPRDGGLRLITIPDTPGFCFDPDANAAYFIPFEKGTQDERYKIPDQRIIAPVPDKAPHLTEEYVRVVYRSAIAIAGSTTCLVSIGYSFSPTDAASFRPVMDALPAGTHVHLVSREGRTPDRLTRLFPTLHFGVVSSSFEAWAAAGFGLPGGAAS